MKEVKKVKLEPYKSHIEDDSEEMENPPPQSIKDVDKSVFFDGYLRR